MGYNGSWISGIWFLGELDMNILSSFSNIFRLLIYF
jgi:hypothetical protein